MHILKTHADLKNLHRGKKINIGFVPTMGALHAGHLSLIQVSKQQNDITICSIFINPTQFNDKKDFEKYPITIEKDIDLLCQAGTDILFLPEVKEMYPNGTNHIKQYDIGYLNTILDGTQRPGHFNGVCNIVHRLLDMVNPTRLYLGEKDYQQCLVIKQLVRSEKLNVEVITCATLRETNGLAMSSRNQRLDEEGRNHSSNIYKILLLIKENQKQVSFATLKQKAFAQLADLGFETEYICLANANTLDVMDSFNDSEKMIVLIAAKFNEVRLIDNIKLN